MDPVNALAFAIKALEAMPSLVKMSVEAVSYLRNTTTALKLMQLEGRDPNDAEWDALNKTIEDLRASRPSLDEMESGSEG